MLEGIDDIPWNQLVACGPAADIPRCLRSLAAQNSGAAITDLWELIYHQGTVYEATAYVVPFLREFLRNRTFKDKQPILELLSAVALGSSYTGVSTDELLWVKNAHEAVGVGVPLYTTLLKDRQIRVRIAAARLLSYFPEHQAGILLTLRQSLSRERNRDVQASLMLCLGMLEDANPAMHSHLEAALRRKPGDPRSLTAALSLIRIDKEKAAPKAVGVVLNALADPEAFPESYVFEMWELDCDPGVEVLETLLFLGPDRAVSAMTELLETMDEPLDALVDFVVETAFPVAADKPHEPTVFNAQQKRVLTALLNADNTWGTEGQWSLGTDVLQQLVNVPQTRDALRAYLSESEAQ